MNQYFKKYITVQSIILFLTMGVIGEVQGQCTVDAGNDVTLDCNTTSVTLNATTTNTSAPVTYSWSPTTGLDDATIAAPVATPTATTTYTVTITDNGGCTASATVTVTVDNTAPTASAGTDATIDCNTTSLTLNGSGGGTYSWSPTTGLDDATIATPVATPSSTTTYTLTVTGTNGCTDTDNVTVTVDNTAPTASAGADATIDCNTTSVTLNGSGGGTYSWSPTTGLDDATIATPVATPSSTTTYTLTVTGTNGCTDTDDVIVTVDISAPTAFAGNDVTINCINTNTVLNGSGGGTYSWSPATGLDDATIATPTAEPPTTTTTYTLTVTGTNGCTDTDDVTVTVDKTPPVANAGPDLGTTCANLNAQLNASGGVSYSWSPTYALSDPNIPNPIATPAMSIVYTVTVTGANGCTATDDAAVTINDVTPLAIAGNDLELCGVYTTNLNADVSGNQPTDVKLWTIDLTYPNGPNPGNVVLSDPSSPNTTISGLQEGEYRLFWTVSNNVCPPIMDTLLVKVYDPPQNQVGPGTAGIDDSLCGVTEVDLNASTPTGTATGKWDIDTSFPNPSNVIFADSTDPNCHISGLQEGKYRLIWTVSNGNCPDATDTVMINVYNSPVADAGTDIDLCNIYNATLNANVPAGTSSGMWSEELNYASPSTVVFDDATLPNAQVSSLIEGTYHLVWTVSNGNCPDAMDTVAVNVYDPPSADAGLDASVCGTDSLFFDTLYFLNAGIPAGTSHGKWTLDLSFANTTTNPIIINDTSINNAGVTNLLEGEYQFVWTVSNGTCADATDTMHVFTYDKPFANAGADKFFCDSSNVNMTASPTIGTSTGQWSADDANNPSIIVFTDVTDPFTSTTGYIEGTYNLIWTVSNDNCNPVSDTVSITIYDQPVAYAGSDIEICATSMAVLDAVPPVGTAQGYWSIDSTFGNLTPITFLDSSMYNTQSSGYMEGTYQLVWTMTNGVCSDSLDTMQVIMYNLPQADAGADQWLCDLDTVQMDGQGEVGTAHGHWELNPNFNNPNIPTFRDSSDSVTWADGFIVGNYEIMWIVENGVCPADTDMVMIYNQERPVAIAGYPDTICNNVCFDMISLSTTPQGTTLDLLWEVNNNIYTDSVVSLCNLDVGIYPVRLVVEASNGCKDSLIIPPSIVVNPSPVAGFQLLYDTDFLIELQPLNIVNTASSDAMNLIYSMGNGDTIITGDDEIIYFYENFGLYPVTQWVENQYGCRDSLELGQQVNKRRTIYIPNTFTPNGDGVNDEFGPVTWAFSHEFYEFTIYDRWGTMIFRTTDMEQKWNGTYKGEVVEDDTYLWQLRYIYINTIDVLQEKGHVNVYK